MGVVPPAATACAVAGVGAAAGAKATEGAAVGATGTEGVEGVREGVAAGGAGLADASLMAHLLAPTGF